jgi:hypothetical protein
MLCISVFMFFESVRAIFLPGHFWSKVGRQADEYITRGVMFLCFYVFMFAYMNGVSCRINSMEFPN